MGRGRQLGHCEWGQAKCQTEGGAKRACAEADFASSIEVEELGRRGLAGPCLEEIIFKDHRETPTERIWLPGGDDYGDYQLPGMEIEEPPQHLATRHVLDAVGRSCHHGFPACSTHYFDTGLQQLRVFDECAATRRCRKGCGHSIAPGRTLKGNAFDTCACNCLCPRNESLQALSAAPCSAPGAAASAR